MSKWPQGGQPKLCRASLNMSLVQTQASLMFFNKNIWWNPIMGSSSACEEREDNSVKNTEGIHWQWNKAECGIWARSYCLGLEPQYSQRVYVNVI
jgi:hypothetical protein